MALGTGQLSLRQIRNHFSLPTDKMSGMTRSNTDRFIGSIPDLIGSSYSDVSISDFHGASNRTAQITVGKSVTSPTYTPDRYGWSLANYSGFYHAEGGVNTAAFGSIQRYQGLIGNNLVGIVTHDVGEGLDSNSDVHLEIFTTSSSNSGWTYMDVKFAGDFQYQSPGYISFTFTRTAASHFSQVGGNGNSYQPTNTVYAWTFTGKSGTNWYGNNSHPTDNDNVRSLHTAFKSAQGGNWYSTPYIRFR